MITKDEYVKNNNIESWKKMAEFFTKVNNTIDNIPLKYSDTRLANVGDCNIPCITRWGHPGRITKDWSIDELFESIKGGISRYMNKNTTTIMLHSISVPEAENDGRCPVFISFINYTKKLTE